MLRTLRQFLTLLLCAVAVPASALEERYGYDNDGRLTESVSNESRTTYEYDAAGNLLEVVPGQPITPPELISVDGAVLRLGESSTVSVQGSHLEGAYLVPGDPCLVVSNFRYTVTGLTFDLSGDACNAYGTYTMTLITPSGAITFEQKVDDLFSPGRRSS